MLSDLLFRARALVRRREVDADLDDELRDHLDAQARKYEEAGLSREEATRRANIEFGGLDHCVKAGSDEEPESVAVQPLPEGAAR